MLYIINERHLFRVYSSQSTESAIRLNRSCTNLALLFSPGDDMKM